MAGRPLTLSLKLGWYLFRQKLKGRRYFPLTMILEPLEECNLTCTGCGRIREYQPILDRKLTVEESLRAAAAGGPPAAHPPGDRGDRRRHPQAEALRLPLHQRSPLQEGAQGDQALALLLLRRAPGR